MKSLTYLIVRCKGQNGSNEGLKCDHGAQKPEEQPFKIHEIKKLKY